jgi:signal transduction histidine kinase
MLVVLFGTTLSVMLLRGAYGIFGVLVFVFGATGWIVYRTQRIQEAEVARVTKKLKKRDRQKSKYTKKLKRLTRQQGEIISAISHEFKNPVAAIIGYAQTIHDDPDLSPELREKFLEKVIRNSARISEMIDRLSLAIKFESHTLELKKERFDLATLTEEISDNLRQKYPGRTLILQLNPTPIEADRMMFAQVITNLIDNALKYSEDTVNITLDAAGFRVCDHGIGIVTDELDKVTQRFFRSDTHSWDNSIGVGLYIVEYILQLHNTQLIIKSTSGVGSTFGFDLPLAAAD